MANIFTNLDLKNIATQAIGGQSANNESSIVNKAQELIDQKIKEIIEKKATDLTNGIDSIANTSDNLTSNPNVSSNLPTEAQGVTQQSSNIMNSLNGQSGASQLQGGLSQLPTASSIPGMSNIPTIPSVPSVSTAIPGGLSIDPMSYIPEPNVPFKAFIKPLLDKAVGAAFKKLNPSAFISKVEGSLGKLQAKATASLQNLENKIQNGLEEAAETASNEVKNKINGAATDLGNFSKDASKQGQAAKDRLQNYIHVYFMRTGDPLGFSRLPTQQRTDFLEIDNAK